MVTARNWKRRKPVTYFCLSYAFFADIITIIQMFPEFLPEKLQKEAAAFDLPANDKKRALLALGNYLSAVRSLFWGERKQEANIDTIQVRADLSKQLDQYNRERYHSQSSLNPEYLKGLHISLQVVDTALLKCYLQVGGVSEQIFHIFTCHCCRPDLLLWILYCDYTTTLVFSRTLSPYLRLRIDYRRCLYCMSPGRSTKWVSQALSSAFSSYLLFLALELLRSQYQDPDSDPFFHGFDRIVGYLQTLGNTHLELIFKYTRWVLDKDVSAGLEVSKITIYRK